MLGIKLELNADLKTFNSTALKEIRILLNEQRQSLMTEVYQYNDRIADISSLMQEKKEEEDNG